MQTSHPLSAPLQQDQITLFKSAYCCADKTQTDVSYRQTAALSQKHFSNLQSEQINLVKRAYFYAKQSLHEQHTSPHGESSCRP